MSPHAGSLWLGLQRLGVAPPMAISVSAVGPHGRDPRRDGQCCADHHQAQAGDLAGDGDLREEGVVPGHEHGALAVLQVAHDAQDHLPLGLLHHAPHVQDGWDVPPPATHMRKRRKKGTVETWTDREDNIQIRRKSLSWGKLWIMELWKRWWQNVPVSQWTTYFSKNLGYSTLNNTRLIFRWKFVWTSFCFIMSMISKGWMKPNWTEFFQNR